MAPLTPRSTAPLNIGISCYPTFGGSGVVATEIGLGMARRGHRVHLFAYDRPARLAEGAHDIHFHRIEAAGVRVPDQRRRHIGQ